MNEYRCQTCEHNDNHYCELFKCRLSFSEISTLEQFGCASHSNFKSERDAVLDEKLARRYKEILMRCKDEIEDTRRKYEIAPKTCDGCSAYDLCKELHQKDDEFVAIGCGGGVKRTLGDSGIRLKWQEGKDGE